MIGSEWLKPNDERSRLSFDLLFRPKTNAYFSRIIGISVRVRCSRYENKGQANRNAGVLACAATCMHLPPIQTSINYAFSSIKPSTYLPIDAPFPQKYAA